MKLPKIFLVLAAIASSSFSFATTTINCRINPETGDAEATAPWRNALGSARADQICRPAKPLTSAMQPQFAQQAVAPQATAPQAMMRPIAPVAPAQPQAMQPVMQMSPAQPQAMQPVMQMSPAQPQAMQPVMQMAPVQQVYAAQPATQAPVGVAHEIRTYDVAPGDVNFRRVLTRWAKGSGWTFNLEHWAVPKDIPVGGAEAVNLDFKSAVRRLLNSTLLNDTPVQPCFYSNRVLRVIPATELCSRSDN